MGSSPTATDNCDDSEIIPEITGVECYFFTRKGQRVDREVDDPEGQCFITFSGDTINMHDAGGVGNTIEWMAKATDASGNKGMETCSVQVVRKKDL